MITQQNLKHFLNCEQHILSLPFTNRKESGYAIYKKKLPDYLFQSLKMFSHDEGVALLSALNILLYRYTEKVEFWIGSPRIKSDNSLSSNLEDINPNVFNIRFSEKFTFCQVCKEVETAQIESQELTSFAKLQSERNKESSTPLLQVLFDFIDMTKFSVETSKTVSNHIQAFQELSGAYIGLYTFREQSGISLSMVYDKGRFSQDVVARILGHLEKVLHNMINQPDCLIEQVSILTEEEQKELITIANIDVCEFPNEGQIHELFTNQVLLNPEAIAIVVGEHCLTFRELNHKVNQLARYLQKQGVGVGDLVGICLGRSAEIIISQLAILKIGAAYVPLDPTYPTERLVYMMMDAALGFVISVSELAEQFAASEAVIINLQDENGNIETESTEELNVEIRGNQLAYMIYTSGSTGRPKGVMVEHHSVRNLYYAVRDHLDLNKHRSIVALASMAFDIFVIESVISLAYGLKVVIANEVEQHDYKALHTLLKTHQIEVLPGTPARLQLMLNDDDHKESFQSVKVICMGGESFPPTLFEAVRSVSDAKILNIYGPTETTVYATIKELTSPDEITIGKPLANYELYIMDKNMQVQPFGVKGEICIAGAGLARGYHNRDELNQERFVQHPYQPGKRMYKTGDIARLLSNGEIEYIERVDHQVKIHGHRIELGEIENVLEGAPKVKQVVVVDRLSEKNTKYLAAYLTVEKGYHAKQMAEWREYLRVHLPSYMVPALFVPMESFPLTPNGKVDRKKLPNPESMGVVSAEYIAPRNPIEERIAAIWTEVLGTQKIGIHDNFLEHGGNSILATQVITRINERFKVKLTLIEFLSEPVIVKIAEKVNRKEHQTSKSSKRNNGIVRQSRRSHAKKLTDLLND
ncbi:hypothetical protein COO17_19005 [Bacillus wiedmannii]|uniref:Carrier domain-containing protein n=1 Tax=Bacillus wiedmannii TaxID=1890302 RepID=A0A2A7BPK0_9BACI|nr:non-ribosomal peptide synthetase [Bacillus wiedmannii]PDY39387.1 hypothetical protein COO17_19005 [Bacillus wiedmannii]